ncbi:MAG: methionine adenosyltransferase domain-containing protein [Nanoarchaeota archaeon]
MATYNLNYDKLTVQRERFAHPDGLGNVISQKILAESLRRDSESRLDLNVTLNDILFITAQNRSSGPLTREEMAETARQLLRQAGYSPQNGYDPEAREIRVDFKGQSPDIDHSVSNGGAGDTIVKHGYATSENALFMPLEYLLLKEMAYKLDSAFRNKEIKGLAPDGKLNLVLALEDGKPSYAAEVVVAAQHYADADLNSFRDDITQKVILPALGNFYDSNRTRITINGAERFEHGSPLIDTGVKGKKDPSFLYGDRVHQTGGSIFGKDFGKVDVHASILARHIAKSLVAQGVVKDYIEVRLGYKIGSGQPMVLDFEASGSTLDRIGLDELVRKNFPLDRDDAVSELRLNDPNLVLLTATEGWFGNDQFPWEKIRTLH